MTERTKIKTMRRMRRQGHSIRMIAKEMNMSYTGTRHHIKDIIVDKTIFTLSKSVQKNKETDELIPLPPSSLLSYLIGVIAGDGFIEKKDRTYRLWISCANDHPDLIEKYYLLVRKLLPGNVKIRPRKDSNCTDITLYGKYIPYLLGLRSGAKKIDDFPIPAWIFEKDEYLIAFVRGLIETDGGVYYTFSDTGKYYIQCKFRAYIPSIMSAFMHATKKLGYNFLKPSPTYASLSTKSDVEKFTTHIGLTKFKLYEFISHKGKRIYTENASPRKDN